MGDIEFVTSLKLTLGIRSPEELEFISKIEEELGEVVPIPTWE